MKFENTQDNKAKPSVLTRLGIKKKSTKEPERSDGVRGMKRKRGHEEAELTKNVSNWFDDAWGTCHLCVADETCHQSDKMDGYDGGACCLNGKNALRTWWNRHSFKYCAGCLWKFGPDDTVHFGHIVPKSMGGNFLPSNILPTCSTCEYDDSLSMEDSFKIFFNTG